MANLAAVRDKALPVLGEFGAQLDSSGRFSVRNESARGFIDFLQKEDDSPVFIRIVIPVLSNVPPTAELYRHIAFNSGSYLIGHLSLEEDDDDSVTVFFEHTILGDYLDSEELNSMVAMTMITANDLDDELQGKFGGERFHEEA